MEWVRSSKCEGASCVEAVMVGDVSPTVLVRNTHYPEVVTAFSLAEWRDFIAGVDAGEFRFDTAANVS